MAEVVASTAAAVDHTAEAVAEVRATTVAGEDNAVVAVSRHTTHVR
jgi:hypothetical protein